MRECKIVSGYFNRILKNIWLLPAMWLLISSPAVWYYVREGLWLEAIDWAARGYLFAFAVVLICSFFSAGSKLGRITKAFFLVLGAFNLILDKGQYNICHEPFGYDSVAVILGSNVSEAAEFIGTFLTAKVILFVVFALLACVGLFLVRKWLANKIVVVLAVLLLVLSVVEVCTTSLEPYQVPSRWDNVFLGKIHLFVDAPKYVDLTQYRKADVAQPRPGRSQAEKVIVVIGEAVSAMHSPMCGYNKETTPYSQKLAEKDSLVVFSDVTSAWYHTIESIKYMFTINTVPEFQGEWYERTTAMDILRDGGYYTDWISNQSPSGFADNIAASFANVCDTSMFLGSKVRGVHKVEYDETLLPEVKRGLQHTGRQCIFVHMAGCHEAFSSRYPAEFAEFTEKDYEDCPQNQRRTLAEYDNALRYGDYVLNEIFQIASAYESVVVFVPDHGLDLYYSDPEYAGHATPGRPEAIPYARKIPFFVYCSRQFCDNFPEKVELLKKRKDEPFNTARLVPFIMYLCNIEFKQ